MDHSEFGEQKKGRSSYKAKRSFSKNKKRRTETGEKRSFGRPRQGGEEHHSGKGRRIFEKRNTDGTGKFSSEKKFTRKKDGREDFSSEKKISREKEGNSYRKGPKKNFSDDRPPKKEFTHKKPKTTFAEQGLTRLNKFIANAGICSRREADALIASGAVRVNGKVITELGYKVKPGDDVNFSGEKLKAEKQVYVLLNKPKDYITTSEDERGRRTVMELIKDACRERVYPVGRLDRNTTGLLLFTNDGQLTKKLTHPMHNVQKLYHVELDKNLKQPDLFRLREGLELEDGFIKPDEVSYAGESKREVGIEIHSGKNRIVRRMFEHLGYDVIKLDRVMFAGLTKKNLPKGRWRLLTEKEVAFLKMV